MFLCLLPQWKHWPFPSFFWEIHSSWEQMKALKSELGLGELGLTVAAKPDSLTYDVSGSFILLFYFLKIESSFYKKKDDSSETSSQVLEFVSSFNLQTLKIWAYYKNKQSFLHHTD